MSDFPVRVSLAQIERVMSDGPVRVSLADIERSVKSRAYAELRKQMKSDDALIDALIGKLPLTQEVR